MPYSPVLIFSASSSTDTRILMQDIGPLNYVLFGAAPAYAPIRRNDVLYAVLQNISPSAPYFIDVWKSTDNGLTWATVDDTNHPIRAASSAAYASAGVWYDEANSKLIICYTNAPAFSGGTIAFQDFDLVAETWGAPYGATHSPIIFWSIQGIIQRSDGTRVVFFNDSGSFAYAVYDVNADDWVPPSGIHSMITNLAGGYTVVAGVAAVLEPGTDTIHVMTTALDGSSSNRIFFYQQILSNNTLGAFFNSAATFPFATSACNPIIAGNNIMIGCLDPSGSYQTLYIGTPLAAPSFSFMAAPGVDPDITLTPPYQLPDAASIGTDGSRIYAVYCYLNTAGGFHSIIRLCSATVSNPTTWRGQTIYDDTGPNVLRIAQSPSINVIPNRTPQISFNGQVSFGGQPTSFYLGGGDLLGEHYRLSSS